MLSSDRNWKDRTDDEKKWIRIGLNHAFLGVVVTLIFFFFTLFINNKVLQIAAVLPLVVSIFNLYLHKRGLVETPAILAMSSFVLAILFVKFNFPSIPSELVLVIVVLGIRTGLQNRKSAKIFIGIIVFLYVTVLLGELFYLNDPFNNPSVEVLTPIVLKIILIFVVLKITADTNQENDEYLKLIVEQKNNISTKGKLIEDQHQDILILKQKHHEQELLLKQRDMELLQTTNSVHLKANNTIVRSIKNILVEDKNLKQHLTALYQDLKRQDESSQTIELSHNNIDLINTQFYDRLRKKCPELSKVECEVAAFLRLRMSAKEIAAVRNVTVNSVNVTKTRIRTKLKLESNFEVDKLLNTF